MAARKLKTARPGRRVARGTAGKAGRKKPAVARKPARRPAVKPARRSARGPARAAGAAGVRQAPRSAAPKGAVRPQAPVKPVKPVKPVQAPKVVKISKPRLKPDSPRVQKLRAMLESKQAEILRQIKRARADSLDVDNASFPEVGDLVSASVEKEKAFEYSEAGVNALREIAGALEKLKGGTYGVCERCGKPIGVKRLEAMPSARLCVHCKTSEEATSKTAPPVADDMFED